MPYFSFSLKQNFIKQIKNMPSDFEYIETDQVYFSKNTNLWKILQKNENLEYLNFLRFEKRKKANLKGKKILFFLPPSIGMGDAIEYGLAIKAIEQSKMFDFISIAFVGRYKMIFKKYFNLHNIFENIISEVNLNVHDIIYHFSLELKNLKNQKYLRSDIEDSIIKKFNVPKIRKKLNIENKKIKTINIFPVSTSPIRSMSIKILNKLIGFLENDYSLNIIFDESSDISNYLDKNIILGNYKKLYPPSLNQLCDIIEKTKYGIFMDSGPLHLAKILGIRGILLITSVNNNILLNDFFTIYEVKNNYVSNYCNAPCGLTNIFNYENNIGCFQTLLLSKKDFYNKQNLNALQRGKTKDNYSNFMINPVGCIKNINFQKLKNNLKEFLL